MLITTAENGDWIYPGDEVVLKTLGETLRVIREEAGLTIEEATVRADKAERELDREATRRACAVAIRNARERTGMDRRSLATKVRSSIANAHSC